MLDYLKKQPLLFAVATLVIGFLLGWWIMGWWLWPVEWVDSDVAHLRQDLKDEYVLLVARGYQSGLGLERTVHYMEQVDAEPLKVVERLQGSVADEETQWQLTQLHMALEQYYQLNPPQTPPAAGQQSLFARYWWVCGLLLVVVAAAAGGLWYWRRAEGTGEPRSVAAQASRISAGMTRTDYTSAAAETPTGAPPVAQFMTTYMLGDDLYDDSFSIDGPDGNFLGECGMGISETIGVGDPKKVTAFEVWLFDKNDIRTVTNVLMSEHAFKDDALKSRLAAKGEPVLVKSGDIVKLETATLVVTARVVDLAYGGGPLPPNSYFERLTIELAAFSKTPPPAAAAAA